MRLERDADDNRTALITPSNARFTDLGMLVSRPTFIEQRTYDRRCRTSHLCHKPTSLGRVRPWFTISTSGKRVELTTRRFRATASKKAVFT
jgi:hypothetical protein